MVNKDYLWVFLLDTVKTLRPFLRRAANTLRPLALLMRFEKPCLFIFFLFEGWNVRFIALFFYK
jgi:hypothetical protein